MDPHLCVPYCSTHHPLRCLLQVVSTSVAVITDFGEASHELDVLMAYLNKGQ